MYNSRVLQMQLMAKANDQRPTTKANDDHSRKDPRRRSERGYILLMLMLFVALLAIAAGALGSQHCLPREARSRRGDDPSRRAVFAGNLRKFVKKTGRYPTRLEELENTNNIRFLRKRYKDPITGKDFKLLHVEKCSSPAPRA